MNYPLCCNFKTIHKRNDAKANIMFIQCKESSNQFRNGTGYVIQHIQFVNDPLAYILSSSRQLNKVRAKIQIVPKLDLACNSLFSDSIR